MVSSITSNLGLFVPRLAELPPIKPAAVSSCSDCSASSTKAVADEDQFRAELEKLSNYIREREARLTAERGDGPPDGAVGVATRVGPDGYSPFITASQQQRIDEISLKYQGTRDYDGLSAELRANGVHPDQLDATAEYFVGPGGVRTRDGAFVRLLDIKA